MVKKKDRQDRKPGEVPISARFTTLTEKPKRGRRTIPDNFLEGARNAWVALLEESWPEIGWSLLCIQKRRNSTIEDVRKAFEPVKEKPHNSGLATAFYRETVETAKPTEVQKSRVRVGHLQSEIHHAQANLNAVQRSVSQAETALTITRADDRNDIQDEITQRQQRLLQLENHIKRLQIEHDALDKKSLDQEAYVYASELLDFLGCRRYALNPRNLANALAGLPSMRWRQSFTRCFRMPFNQPTRPYLVVEVLSKIWRRRRNEFEDTPVELFRAELLALSKKHGYTRQFLLDNWRDLRLAIEECWKSKETPESIPFVLSSIFMRKYLQQKDVAEQVLAEREKLEG